MPDERATEEQSEAPARILGDTQHTAQAEETAPVSLVPGLPAGQRIVVIVAVTGAAVLAGLWTAHMTAAMYGEMDFYGAMATISEVHLHPWIAADAAMMFAMWAIMLVGLMAASATSMVLTYADMTRMRGGAIPPVWLFVAGYLLIWTAFSAVATAAQWGVEQAALLSPTMVAASPFWAALSWSPPGYTSGRR